MARMSIPPLLLAGLIRAILAGARFALRREEERVRVGVPNRRRLKPLSLQTLYGTVETAPHKHLRLGGRASLVPSLEDWGVGIDAAIAQKRPVAACFFDARGIAFDDEDFFLVGGTFGEDAAKWIGNEGMPPEFEAAFGSALEPDAIHSRDEHAVGDGVRALNRAPGVELRRAEFLFLRRMPANRRGIKNNVGAAEARQARAFRIPLVPAHQHADAAEFRIE